MTGRRLPLGVAVALIAAGTFSCVRDSTVDFRQPLSGDCYVAGAICSVGYEGVGDGSGLAASFAGPLGLWIDSAGNVFIADTGENRIREIASGTAITLVGDGHIQTISNDGVLATAARVFQPSTVAACGGSVFFLHYYDGYFSLIGWDGKIHVLGGGSGPADPDVSADLAQYRFDNSLSLSCDGNDLLIPDPGNHVVRLYNTGAQSRTVHGVTIAPGHVAIVAGTGSSGTISFGVNARSTALSSPVGAWETPDGRLFIADFGNGQVAVVGSDDRVSLVAGAGVNDTNGGDGGLATAASFYGPSDVEVRGNVVLITAASKVRAVNLGSSPESVAGITIAPGAINTVAGDGDLEGVAAEGLQANEAFFDFVSAAFDPAGDLVVQDQNTGMIYRVAGDGVVHTLSGLAGTSDFALAAPDLDQVISDGKGELLVSAFGTRVLRIDPLTGTRSVEAGNGSTDVSGDGGQAVDAGLMAGPLALGPDGSLYVGDFRHTLVRRITPDGIIHTIAGGGGDSSDGALALDAALGSVDALLVDPSGQFLVIAGDDVVRAVNLGTTAAVFATVAIDPGTIRRIAGTGVNTFTGDGGPALAATMNLGGGAEMGLALDGDSLYLSDSYNQRVRRITLSTGIIDTAIGNGNEGRDGDGGSALAATVGRPTALAIHQGHLYVGQNAGPAVRDIDLATNVIETVAGDGSTGYFGDHGRAIDAELTAVSGLAFDSDGALYIADTGNHHLRRVQR